MNIQFQDARSERLFNSESELRRKYGPVIAARIQERLEQLAGADCLQDLKSLPGKWHALKGDLKGKIAAQLTANDRLIIVPAEKPTPELPAGGLDWFGVKAVMVVEVIDYH